MNVYNKRLINLVIFLIIIRFNLNVHQFQSWYTLHYHKVSQGPQGPPRFASVDLLLVCGLTVFCLRYLDTPTHGLRFLFCRYKRHSCHCFRPIFSHTSILTLLYINLNHGTYYHEEICDLTILAN